ncbi:MAG: sigma 54-interacting transcriptional regulator [Planctomycetes bacterium]|nr:sigma 54-interacting transcriptional regulator [Planctomycetota bacterium]
MNQVLLIEDDPGAQLLYRNRLADLGHRVVVSSTGAMGLVEARATPFDLFLVDVELGSGIDGYEVCRRLKTIPGIHGVPVVLISGRVKTHEDLHRGYEAGCQSFLVKGDLTLLEDTVRAMLRIKSLQDELALQNRLLEERNRRFEADPARNPGFAKALASHQGSGAREHDHPDGLLLVDGEGVVRSSDRGARELFGQLLDGKHLALLAPDSRLEASVRNARTEPLEPVRFEVPERPGRRARQLVASIHPLVPNPERLDLGLGTRVVLLHDLHYDAASKGQSSAPDRRGKSPALRREWAPLVEAARATYRPSALLGTSAALQELRQGVEHLVRDDQPVQLRGPSGSGKLFVARILHYSGAHPGPFVTLACGAFGARALEAELFGSGDAEALAGAAHAGAILEAEGGTLFLQDVERLPLPLQERLLEALDGGRFQRPLSAPERFEARLVVGTRVDLQRAAAEGQFLSELARRLAARALFLPALAERAQDIAPLCRHFLTLHARFEGARFSARAAWLLTQHDWPENVRELEHTVHEACASARAAEIGVEHLPPRFVELEKRLELAGIRAPAQAPRAEAEDVSGARREPTPPIEALDSTVSLLVAYERQALLHALREKQGDKMAAAKLLDVGKSTLYRKLREHGIT